MKYRKKSLIEATQNIGPQYEITSKIGRQMVYTGDWLIRNPDGEVYPCDNETFHNTYEEVIDTPTGNIVL